MKMTNNISLIDDHDEALKIWRQKGFKNLDLVHIDAHIDFGFHPAKPKEQIIKEAETLNQLRLELEKSLLYQRYEKDFDKQTNIENYIYPAMCEGIIKDFYWVIPGRLKEFKKSLKIIKGILKGFLRQDPYRSRHTPHATRHTLKEGVISTKFLGRKFVICTLEKLPTLKEKVLLDIDTDFLVIDSLLNANNTAEIGKKTRWIRPDRLVKELLEKIINPVFITIAYSVNGGYTPMRYKVLGDELAYRLSPKHFEERFGQKSIASVFFERFESTGKKEYYQKAIKLDPSYRAADNNYGPLYLALRRFSKAKKEFLKILSADPKNPFCLCGLGNIALENKDFKKAKGYFSSVLDNEPNEINPVRYKRLSNGVNEHNGQNETHKLFSKTKVQGLLGLAQAEFRLKNFKKAKELFCHYQTLQPLQPQTRYFLGRIYEKGKDFEMAAACYQDAIRLGLSSIDLLYRLLKISCYIKAKDDIIKYVSAKYKEFKKEFLRRRKTMLNSGKKTKGWQKIEKKIASVERILIRNEHAET